MTEHLYDADGNRVAKGPITAFSCDTSSNGFGATGADNLYILSPGGQQLTEMSWSGGQAQFGYTNVRAAGQLIAKYSPNGSQVALSFDLRDWLGTLRARTDYAGNVLEKCQSLPYGNGESCVTQPYLFTGKERDSESGNDYFGARYYASSMGRWLSPDVVNITEERMMSPSSTLNKYAYAANNPLKYIDPDGQDIVLYFQNGAPGHIMMMAYDPSLPRAAFRSFGPANAWSAGHTGSLATIPGIPVPATNRFDFDNGLKMKTADDIRKNFASITIKTSPEVTQQVVQALLAHSNDQWYATLGGACASTCARILHQIAQFKNLGTNNLLTPYQFFNQAYQEYGNGKAAVPWGDGTTNVFKAGTNYGSYQPNWNEFDMLNLLVHQGCARTGYDDTGNPNGQGSAAMSGCQ